MTLVASFLLFLISSLCATASADPVEFQGTSRYEGLVTNRTSLPLQLRIGDRPWASFPPGIAIPVKRDWVAEGVQLQCRYSSDQREAHLQQALAGVANSIPDSYAQLKSAATTFAESMDPKFIPSSWKEHFETTLAPDLFKAVFKDARAWESKDNTKAWLAEELKELTRVCDTAQAILDDLDEFSEQCPILKVSLGDGLDGLFMYECLNTSRISREFLPRGVDDPCRKPIQQALDAASRLGRPPNFQGELDKAVKSVFEAARVMDSREALFQASEAQDASFEGVFQPRTLSESDFPSASVTPWLLVGGGVRWTRTAPLSPWTRNTRVSPHVRLSVAPLPEIRLSPDATWLGRLFLSGGWDRVGLGSTSSPEGTSTAEDALDLFVDMVSFGMDARVIRDRWWAGVGTGLHLPVGARIRQDDLWTNQVIEFPNGAPRPYAQAGAGVYTGGQNAQGHTSGGFFDLTARGYQMPEIAAGQNYDVQRDGQPLPLPTATPLVVELRVTFGVAL